MLVVDADVDHDDDDDYCGDEDILDAMVPFRNTNRATLVETHGPIGVP